MIFINDHKEGVFLAAWIDNSPSFLSKDKVKAWKTIFYHNLMSQLKFLFLDCSW